MYQTQDIREALIRLHHMLVSNPALQRLIDAADAVNNGSYGLALERIEHAKNIILAEMEK